MMVMIVMMVTMVMCGQAKVDERDGPLLRWRNIDGSHSDKLPALGATPNIFTTKQTNNEEIEEMRLNLTLMTLRSLG